MKCHREESGGESGEDDIGANKYEDFKKEHNSDETRHMCLYLNSGTDDYYVLEADLSSTGGYVNLINISVPISKIIFLGLISNLL